MDKQEDFPSAEIKRIVLTFKMVLDFGILHGWEAAGKDEMERDQLLLSDTGKVTMKGTELWRQQVYAVARMHFLNLKRESKIWGTL